MHLLLTPRPKATETLVEIQAVEASIAAIKRAHLTIPTLPQTAAGQPLNPQLTLDLASTPSDKLGKLLTQFTAYADYTAWVAAITDVESVSAEQVLEQIIALVRLEKSGTVSEKADKTERDPRVREARARAMQTYAANRLTSTLLRNAERDLSAVSREISRRGQEWERNK